MTEDEARKIAKRFFVSEENQLDLMIELLKANEEGYTEAMQDTNDCLGRIQAGKPKQ